MAHLKSRIRSGHILLLAILFYLILTAAYTMFTVHQEKAEWIAELDRDLLNAAQSIPLILNPGFFERAAYPGAISKAEDRQNIDRLTRLADSLGLTYLYTLVEVDGTVYITSSSASAEERQNNAEVRTFTAYPEMADKVRETLADGTPRFRTYTDRWGTFRHVYLPLKTALGIPYVLAADQSMSELNARLKQRVIQEATAPIFFILVAIPFFIAYRMQVRKHTNRLQRLNQELAENRERSQIATKAGGIGVWDRDLVNDRLVWDEQMYELYGVDKKDFSWAYEAWQQCIHPDDRERVGAEVTTAETGEKAFDTDFRIILPNGEIRHIRAFGKTFRDKNGTPLRMIGTNQDITELNETRTQLAKNRDVLNDAQAIAHIGSWEYFISEDKILWSDEMYRIFGLHAGDPLPGWEEIQTCMPDDWERLDAAVQGAIQGTAYDEEARLIRPDGSVRWTRTKGSPVRDKNGRIVRLIGTTQDITASKRTEEKLRESKEKLRYIIESSTNMFYSHTPEHVLNYVSPQVKNILGYEIEEALVRWTELATDHPTNEQAMLLTQAAIRTGSAQSTYEAQLRHKDGHLVWVEVREAPAVENGKTVAIVGSLTDITQRKVAEEELIARNEELEKFNKASIGRELRMVELKKDINALCRELGRPEPYPV